MHELPVIKNVLQIAINHANEEHAQQIRKIDLVVGELHDLIPELVDKYFHYLSQGTIAENARLNIQVMPVFFRCNQCRQHFVIHFREGERVDCCSNCGSEDLTLIGGNELSIDAIEIA